MRRSKLTYLALITSLGLLYAAITPVPGPRCQGLTVRQWEAEVHHWSPALVWTEDRGAFTLWVREPLSAPPAADPDGVKSEANQGCVMPLLKGDPAAVPVLTALLSSKDSKARWLAAQGLGNIGVAARPAVPALIRGLEDENPEVRGEVGVGLLRIDREAAKRLGVEFTGLMRDR